MSNQTEALVADLAVPTATSREPTDTQDDGDRPSLSARAERWLQENAAAIDEWNAYVEKHGLLITPYCEQA